MPLKINARQTQPLDLTADVVVMGTWTFPKSKADKKKKKDDGKQQGTGVPFVDALDRALGGGVSRLIAKEEFKGKKDQPLSMSTLGRVKADGSSSSVSAIATSSAPATSARSPRRPRASPTPRRPSARARRSPTASRRASARSPKGSSSAPTASRST